MRTKGIGPNNLGIPKSAAKQLTATQVVENQKIDEYNPKMAYGYLKEQGKINSKYDANKGESYLQEANTLNTFKKAKKQRGFGSTKMAPKN